MTPTPTQPLEDNPRLLPPEQTESATAVFSRMLDAYASQLHARGNKIGTIDGIIESLNFVARVLGFPWQWKMKWEEYQGGRHADGRAMGSLRLQQRQVEGFFRFLTSSDHEWPRLCRERFACELICPVTDANRILHAEENESDIHVRSFQRSEIRQLFEFMRAEIDRLAESRKGAVTAFRDLVLFVTAYAYGLRRAELCELCSYDWHANLYLPQFGDYGAVIVRNGKAKPNGSPRRRVVFTTPLMGWAVPQIEQYVRDVRPLFPGSDSHLFVTERGEAFDVEYASTLCRKWCDAAGLDPVLTLHSFRRSFATHHIESGYSGSTVSKLLGHEQLSSIQPYLDLGDDYLIQQLLRAQAEA